MAEQRLKNITHNYAPNPKRVLIYSRPAWHEWWWNIAKQAYEGAELVGISEFKGSTDHWLMEHVYALSTTEQEALPFPPFDEDEIILRCRLLREIDRPKARRMIKAVWHAINKIFDDVKPDHHMTWVADNYVRDLIGRYCRMNDIPVMSITNCPIPGHCLPSYYGELNPNRTPDDAEVERTIKTFLKDDFRPKYLIKNWSGYSPLAHFKRVLRYKLKALVYKALLTRDPYNYEYLSLPHTADKKRFMAYFETLACDKDWQAKWENRTKPGLYMPLHFTPEMTVDYWTRNLDFASDYLNTTIALAKRLSKDFTVIIKEHPAAMGIRDKGFYKALSEINDVILVSGNEPSVPIHQSTDVVLTWTGTAGLEGLLRGKKVVLVGNPYYEIPDTFVRIDSLDDIATVKERLDALPDWDLKEKSREIIAHILSGSMEGSALQVGYTSDENVSAFAKSIRRLLNTNVDTKAKDAPVKAATG